MKKYSKRTLLVNSFGAFGYITCLVLWCWIGIVYLPTLLENDRVSQLLFTQPSEEIVVSPETSGSSPVVLFIAVCFTVAIMVLTVFVLLKAPATITKTGKNITTKAASTALPLITRGQAISKSKERRLTASLIKISKLLLVLLPVAASYIGLLVEPSLPLDVVIFVSSMLALIAVFWFSVQYVFARTLGIDSVALV